MTIRDVAERAGVSTATVSKVINHRYGVSAATFSRVMGVIEETGYQASLVAQSLRNHRTNVIGILVADVEPFTAELLKGAADVIRGGRYELVVYSAGGHTAEQDGWERRHLSRLLGTLIDGALVVTPSVVDVDYGSPVVAVDPRTGPSDLPCVDADNLRGARLATEHLIALGHRRIAMLTGWPALTSSSQREQGFRSAMADAGLRVDERLMVEGDYDEQRSLAAVRTLLALPRPPTALFAANDVGAVAAVTIAREAGLSVPQDLSVVGFDNIPESALCDPPLTTISQPIRQMGVIAVRMLIGLIEGEDPQQHHVTVPTELVVRASTAARTPSRRSR